MTDGINIIDSKLDLDRLVGFWFTQPRAQHGVLGPGELCGWDP